MAEDREICHANHVMYSDIRKAMCTGARTMAQMQESAGVCGVCSGCQEELPGVLSSVCGCKEVSLAAVIDAVKNGATTVEAVGQVTGAGTGEDCGRCQKLIDNIITLGY